MKGINSKLIHGDLNNPSNQNFRSLKTPIYDSASFDFETAADMEAVFNGRSAQFAYSRTANPTVAELQNRLKFLTEARFALCLSSGMAAIANVAFTLCSAGDNVLASKYLFGNTYSFFRDTLAAFGVAVRFVDFENPAELEANIDDSTRMVFLEMVTNPQLIIFDIESISSICKQKNVPLVVDNTALTPYLFDCKSNGVDIEIFSNTKFISGGATSVGGTILVYDSKKYAYNPKLKNEFDLYGDDAFFKRLYREVFRNIGACLAPNNAYLQLLGLETLTLRIDKVNENALAIAKFLQAQPSVKYIEYNALESSPYHERAVKWCKGKSGALINLELESKEKCFAFINALKLIRRGTNFCDNKSMIIHPATTIYADCTAAERQELKIFDTTIRFSVGIEDLEDLETDILQALSK